MTPHADDSRLEARLLGAVLAYELGKDMIASGVWMQQTETMIGRIALLSSSAVVFAYVWMALALLVAPYLFVQITGRFAIYRATATRLACWAVLGSGVLWVYLAYLSKNLDYGSVTWVLVLHGLTCIAMAGILACSLNAAQRRAQENAR